MKKKIILMAVALGLVTTTIVGGTLAATTYQASTQAKDAKIDTKKLSICIVDETETDRKSVV